MSANLQLLVRVARKVEPLLDELVFVGGAIVELYLTDPVSDRVRPTADVDAVCQVSSYSEYHRLGERLREQSFRQSARDADPIYRWRSGTEVLDLMPRDASILGFTNPWYEHALAENRPVEIDAVLAIRVPEPPVYLATKLAAHGDRAREDPFTSIDLEDVVALLSGRPELPREVAQFDPQLRR